MARDPSTGELGVAVQSHWFAVGSVVAWARPGVGAAATQSVAEVAHGPNALEQMHAGLDASSAIAAVLAEDDLAHSGSSAWSTLAGGRRRIRAATASRTRVR